MVQWKMSCHLMEELPVEAGRSVATGAMCVNLFPCHFFCLSFYTPPLIPTFFFLFPSPSSFPKTPLPLPTLLCDKLLLAVDLLVVKSAPCAEGVWWCGGVGGGSAPPPSTPACRHHLSPAFSFQPLKCAVCSHHSSLLRRLTGN